MKREKYIDAAKGLGILTVVYAHVISRCGLMAELGLVHKMIYAFHMPLFFFISGYCLGLKKDTGERPAFLPALKKISRNLLLPYIVWSAVYLFISGKLESPQRLNAVFTARGIAPLWFLAALALCELAFAVLRLATYRLSKKNKTALYLLLSVVLFGAAYVLWLVRDINSLNTKTIGMTPYYLFVTASRFMLTMPILLLGYVVSQAELIKKAGKLKSGIFGGLLLGATCVVVALSQLSANFHLFKSSNLPVLMCTSLMGSLGILMLSYALGERSKILNFMGVNSLAIMILHYMPFRTMDYSNILARTFTNNPFLLSLLATIAALLISLLLVWFIKNKFFIYK